MEKGEKNGFLNLARKSFAVITASISTLLGSQPKALPGSFDSHEDNKNHSENLQKRILKPQLILKLNMSDPESSLISMHTSHSSHRSHSSHSSHSSHFSSSPSYTPSYSPPAYTPSTQYTPPKPITIPPYTPYKAPSSTNNTVTVKREQSDVLIYYTLGSRILYKGCEGTDVKELQELLLKLGYDVPLTGYFGEKTEIAVKQFQRSNELKADGRVGSITLVFLKS